VFLSSKIVLYLFGRHFSLLEKWQEERVATQLMATYFKEKQIPPNPAEFLVNDSSVPFATECLEIPFHDQDDLKLQQEQQQKEQSQPQPLLNKLLQIQQPQQPPSQPPQDLNLEIASQLHRMNELGLTNQFQQLMNHGNLTPEQIRYFLSMFCCLII
jgi:hypothetical protein